MLTPDQLTAIDQHLRNQLSETKWFRQERFIAEITDHYVDTILASMDQGKAFNSALECAYNNFGRRDGLKKLELHYWRLSARNYQRMIVRQMLAYVETPRLFVTLSLIGLFLFIRTNFVWSTYWSFYTILFIQNILFILDRILRYRSKYAGRLQPFIQRVSPLATRVSRWALSISIVEMFSSPLLIGKASPYLATFLYTAGIILHLSIISVNRQNALIQQ